MFAARFSLRTWYSLLPDAARGIRLDINPKSQNLASLALAGRNRLTASPKGTHVVYSGLLICLDDRAIGTQLDTQ